MKTTVCREITFSSAHRLLNYNGECARLHGHNWKVILCLSKKEEVRDIMVDFKELDRFLKKEVKDRFDHRCILHKDDPLVNFFRAFDDPVVNTFSMDGNLVLMDSNPTAENFAWTIAKLAKKEYPTYSIKVEVKETDKSTAVVTLE